MNLHRIHLREFYQTGQAGGRAGQSLARPRRRPISTAAGPFGPNDYVYVHVANQEMWRSLARIDRAAGAGRRSALCGRARPREPRRRDRRARRGVDGEAHQARGHGEARRGRRALRRRPRLGEIMSQRAPRRPRHDRGRGAPQRGRMAMPGQSRAHVRLPHRGHAARRSWASTARRSTASSWASMPPPSRLSRKTA